MGKTQLFISIGGAMLSGVFALAMGWRNNHDTKVIVFSTLFGLVGVFVIQFVIKLFAAPAKMELEANENHVEELRRMVVEKQALATEVQRLSSALMEKEEQAKPLEIDMPSTIGSADIVEWKADLVARIENKNPSREVSGVVIRLLNIAPPLKGRGQYSSHTTDDCDLRNIKFKFNDLPADTLNGGAIGRVSILEAERTTPQTKVKIRGQWASNYTNEFIPDPAKEYTFTVEATANKLNRKESQFKISFPIPATQPVVMSTAIRTPTTAQIP